MKKNIRKVDLWMIRGIIYYFVVVIIAAVIASHRYSLLPVSVFVAGWFEVSLRLYRSKKRVIRGTLIVVHGIMIGVLVYFTHDLFKTLPYLYVTITVFFTMMYGWVAGFASIVMSMLAAYLLGGVVRHQVDWSLFEWLFYFGVQLSVMLIVHNLNQAVIQKNRLATRDGLTGLYNHRYFQEYLRYQFNALETENQSIALILGDIDHFKMYNDTYGHPAGDEVLKDIAQILQENVRGTDIVARYGGEEFIIVLPNASLEDAEAVAERIRSAVDDYSFQHGKLTMSMGISIYPTHASTKDELISSADQALYRAKQWRNKVCS